ncbi:S-adenosyl-L-methionine-dependent methyltransferase [Raphidocelis subcapitata]|uniref:S-adenosyl-L-methionine-dependent methyltransferase n=1 Tax=Raphidocelis subcapitata TaxID=307507 RepID=A0A2V0PCK7_9CHLO|nr:S-adenosyl-L-methionine-dependent methyltransferase [Raphidocelis subcapitata]|eukprot:GBF97576.1 S-adenosyl-L-methionine-dependent methyltransferase [Raphidocelis subcapitata]
MKVAKQLEPTGFAAAPPAPLGRGSGGSGGGGGGGGGGADSEASSGDAAAFVAAVPAAAGRARADGRFSALRALTKGSKTNADMLVFRTLNRDMGHPNANADHIAPLLRDKLMPLRSKWLAAVPGARAAFRRGLEHPRLGTPGVVNFVDARTKWFDSEVEAALARGVTQVVAVAAGFDTRAYRKGSFPHWGGLALRLFGAAAAAAGQEVSCFEVDLPAASERKRALIEALLPPGPRPAYVAADLSATPLMDALAGAGFDFGRPALFTIEGLLYYLPAPAVSALLGGIAARAAPGSAAAFDFLSSDALEGRRAPPPPAYKVTARSVANKGEPFVSGMPEGAEGVQALLDAAAAGARAGGGGGAAARRLRLVELVGAQAMAARQLPHLVWPKAGGGSPPPMLSFYSFAKVEVRAGTE